MQEVTLKQMLEARESRVRIQKNIIAKYNCPVISFTMNIAGPIKYTPVIERAFWEGLTLLKAALNETGILCRYVSISETGCEAILAVDNHAQLLKEVCTSIEDGSSLGRLFDMDVLNTDGSCIKRQNTRGCMVCGARGRACAAGRLHSVAELQAVTAKIINDYFASKDAKSISQLATESLTDEVYTTPKPGLVDKNNSGSHCDMDIDTFVKSAHCLKSYFESAFMIGYENRNAPHADCFDVLRARGTEAEEAMYSATKGVNTHKGIIYSMGIICAAMGRLWKAEEKCTCEQILCEASKLAEDAANKDFENIKADTAGGRLYLEYGIRGIRGEAADGFPSVRDIAMPIYTEALKSGTSSNDAGVLTLIHLIANVKDTNLYNRGGISGAQYAAARAREIIKSLPVSVVEQAKKLDSEFIERNLSPGGCADLLALTYFLKKYQEYHPF